MKSNILIAGVAAASLIATAGMATAFGNKGGERMGPRGMMPSFEELDTNADGKVTKEEMQAHRKAMFDKADTNGDGKLSTEEMTAAAETRKAERMAKRQTRMLEKFDTDGDGALSFEEMPGQGDRAGKMFDRADADGDGAITKDEMADMGGKMGKRGKQQLRKNCN
ncbi:EF-hand domain-containing protein [Alisedimentitalea sp. MJ-SS2]|uniref:EF-hand domain-containing protein n=1 Tax=Aliisedimentitalea sp. MJ-SS2 TaxID=3049795 RepID=UPI002907D3C0|nr:EF-hand domain-containing protein [Alisedimentitalea sp. MJ-SS2]MDU8927130.1 EF-hand domain-containing protein [Alisedimentitalea sp. MJ-SS2]